jgi:hypothetical protein
VAKTQMMCPFSGELCRDCSVYRGRHFYLCFCQKYRGCLSETGKTPSMSRTGSNGKFEMPSLLNITKDPYINEML